MEDPPSYHSIQVVNDSDLPVETRSIEEAVALCLQMAHADPSNVRILIAPDDVVADLNFRFRKVPEATDVLTFSDEDAASGDIAIAGPYALRQAKERNRASGRVDPPSSPWNPPPAGP
jgi:ssRNA-specific RNase YbeY (16S rRNA maturation enzyme)